jgi:hypothetical protein
MPFVLLVEDIPSTSDDWYPGVSASDLQHLGARWGRGRTRNDENH